jgi:DNA replication and repair protein RecF
MGEFCAIVFSPEDLNLIKGGPDRRRDFLDIALGQIKPRYVPLMLEYNKILSQRNALLKDIGRFPSIIETLEIWDEAFVKIASILTHYRLRYTKILAPLAENFYSEMANKKESLKMIYSNADILNDMEIKDIKEYFKNTLIKNRALDIKTGFTQIGPHRDDFEITINDMSSKNFGSQGQQRSIVLALKLAESEVLRDILKKDPVILLDDVMSELDKNRKQYILSRLKDSQCFITCCDKAYFENTKAGSIYKIDDLIM